MSMLNKGLDLSIRNCYIELHSKQDARLRAIRYKHLDYTVPHAEQRDSWRENVLHALFAKHLTPLWKQFSVAAKIPLAILWENTAIYIYVLYEQGIMSASTPEQLQQCQDDFHYMMQAAGGELFGLRKNPLSAYYHSPLTLSAESKPVRIRKTCCYYYKIDNIRGYCKSCPLR